MGNGIVLPCNVGDTLWEVLAITECDVTGGRVVGYCIKELTVNLIYVNAYEECVCTSSGARIPFSEFGKTVFLSRNEAEYALAFEQLKEYKPDAKSIVIGRFVGGNEDAE